MKHNKLTAALVAATLILGVGTYADDTTASPETEQVKPQTVCPVLGGKINKKQYADVKGYRIYVCCPMCIGKIKADPDKYIKKMEDDGITIEKAPQKEEAQAAAKEKSDHSDHQH